MIVFKFICPFLSGFDAEVQWGSKKIPAMSPLSSHSDAPAYVRVECNGKEFRQK